MVQSLRLLSTSGTCRHFGVHDGGDDNPMPRVNDHELPRIETPTAHVEKMFAAVPPVGIDLLDLELIRRRLAANETELLRTASSRRRTTLEKLVETDIEILIEGYKKLEAAVEHSRTT